MFVLSSFCHFLQFQLGISEIRHHTDVRQSSCIFQAVVRKLQVSHQKVVRERSGSRKAVRLFYDFYKICNLCHLLRVDETGGSLFIHVTYNYKAFHVFDFVSFSMK